MNRSIKEPSMAQGSTLPFEWLEPFRLALNEVGIKVRFEERRTLAPLIAFTVDSSNWAVCATVACSEGLRWSTAWGEHHGAQLLITSCFEKCGDYLLLRTGVELDHATLPSQALAYPAARRSERHIRDLLGVRFNGHVDQRRWSRHQAWSKGDHPLRNDFPLAGAPAEVTPPDREYPFLKAKGSGVYEIPVGPIHAGIIEPGHFRFQAVGETVLNLEQRFGYAHKGIEKIAVGRTPDELLRLASRVSGDTTVGHAWAAAMAMERAARVEIPLRAAIIRAILAERERIGNHLGDMGAICNDVSFTFGQIQFTRLRELWLRENFNLFGHRLLMDQVTPGGVKNDLTEHAISAMNKTLKRLKKELAQLLKVLDVNSSLEERLQTTGRLTALTAHALGTVGFVARSSGQSFDLRRDAPYPPYDQMEIKVPLESQGDVASRFWLRNKELHVACGIIATLLHRLRPGSLNSSWNRPAEAAEGVGLVEGWRGEIVCYVRFDQAGRISRFYPRDPSILNWPALEKIVLNNIVPDFPVCNKSLNGSYSGNDL